MRTAKAKPTAQPMRSPRTDSASVVAAWSASNAASEASATTTCVGLGRRKLGTIPAATTSCHASKSTATVADGITARRTREGAGLGEALG